MAIEVVTKDCTALGDAELAEMADLSAGGLGWEVGALSKAAEAWVLVSSAFERDKLRGFVFSTLERIGGTPALVIGVASVGRTRSRSTVLRGLMHDQFHKALMAFPDEDVVVSARIIDASPFEAFEDLTDVRPWPEVRPNGEERAWGRRLAKRYGAVAFDDRTMLARGVGDELLFDHESNRAPDVVSIFTDCDPAANDFVVAWGWAMAEFLEGFEKPAT